MYVPRRPLVRALGSRPASPRPEPEAGRSPSGDEVRAVLCAPDQDRGLPAGVEEISGELVRLRIPNEVNPSFPVGASVAVRLIHPSGEAKLEGVLTQRIEQPVARIVVVRWVGDVGLLGHPAVARLFERRLAVRAVPSAAEPVPVVLSVPSLEPPVVEACTATDVSVGGLGAVVSARFDRAAAAVTRLTCGLTLPGSGVHHTLPVLIGNREWLGAGTVRYGLRFEIRDSARDRRALADLRDWVLARGAAVAG